MRHSTAGAALALMALALGAVPAVSFAGSSPPGAPVALGCLSVTAGTCNDGGGGNAGGYYALQHIVSRNGYVFSCATLNTSGMCPTPALTQWSTLLPSDWVARDRTYLAARFDGATFGSFPTGVSYDSAAYASGGQWVIDSADALEALWVIVGMLGILIVAVTFRVGAK